MNDTETIIDAVCKGDVHAKSFCSVLHSFCHTVDDLVDNDHSSFTPPNFVKELIELVITLSANPFFLANKVSLLPVMIQALIAWGDSMEWEKSGDSVKVRDAEVLKGMYHEVFYHVAFLTGGVSNAQSVTHRYREYNHENRGSNYGMV